MRIHIPIFGIDFEIISRKSTPAQPGEMQFYSPENPPSDHDRDIYLKAVEEYAKRPSEVVNRDGTVEPELPTKGGRSSVPTNTLGQTLDNLIVDYSTISPDFPIELLTVLEYMAKFNEDVSYAVDNIVQLGNTRYLITFDGSVDDEAAGQMRTYIEGQSAALYSGGLNSLINDCFANTVITGALSVEMIPSRGLRRIENVVTVPAKTIRFKYNKKTTKYDAYQQASGILAPKNSPEGLIPLSKATYRYYALRRFSDSPYGTPPLLSALEAIAMEKDMLKNMQCILQKLGIFGFLTVLMKQPVRLPNETDTAYMARCAAYLAAVQPEIEKGFTSGIVTGYQGAHTFDMVATNMNLAGVSEIFDLIMQRKGAGLKQDPLMLGRNFNVAETMARVIMAKLSTQVGNYQRLIASFLTELFNLMLRMAGFNPSGLYVEFEPPMIGDRLRDEQAYKQKIDNRLALRNAGIIGQQQAAHELDYPKADAEKDVDYTVPHQEDIAKKQAGAKDPSTATPTPDTGA